MIRRLLQWLQAPAYSDEEALQFAREANRLFAPPCRRALYADQMAAAKRQDDERRRFEQIRESLLPYLPQRAASELAKHGAAMRRESERAKRLRVMNDLRRQLGLPEWRA